MSDTELKKLKGRWRWNFELGVKEPKMSLYKFSLEALNDAAMDTVEEMARLLKEIIWMACGDKEIMDFLKERIAAEKAQNNELSRCQADRIPEHEK